MDSFHSNSHNHNNPNHYNNGSSNQNYGYYGSETSQTILSFENTDDATINDIDSYLENIDNIIGDINNKKCNQQGFVKEIADLRKKLSEKCAENEHLVIKLVKHEKEIIDLQSELQEKNETICGLNNKMSIKQKELKLKCRQYRNLQNDYIELQDVAEISECDRQIFDENQLISDDDDDDNDDDENSINVIDFEEDQNEGNQGKDNGYNESMSDQQNEENDKHEQDHIILSENSDDVDEFDDNFNGNNNWKCTKCGMDNIPNNKFCGGCYIYSDIDSDDNR